MDDKNLCPHTLRHVAGMLRERYPELARSSVRHGIVGVHMAMDAILADLATMASKAEPHIAPLRDVGSDTPTRRIERPS